jgi:DNA-binding IclR family transcriptional regulator
MDEGIKCVAGPIKDYNGRVIATVSVSGLVFRIEKLGLTAIVADVVTCCKAISDMIMKY